MNLTEVKDRLYDAVERFFPNTSIIWVNQSGAKPNVPYVTLSLGSSVQREAFPIDDGEGHRVYPSSTIAEINIYTMGRQMKAGDALMDSYENTAVDDLTELSNYLESEGMVDYFSSYDIDISLMSPIRDLSELKNETKYRYRAMAEYRVSYLESAGGYFGMADMPCIPNSSGGGIKEMAVTEVAAIDEIEISEGGKEDEK